jgi:hypothetical protein
MGSGNLQILLEDLGSGNCSGRRQGILLGTVRHSPHNEANAQQTTADDDCNQCSGGQDARTILLVLETVIHLVELKFLRGGGSLRGGGDADRTWFSTRHHHHIWLTFCREAAASSRHGAARSLG